VLNKYDYFGYGKTFAVMIIWFNSVQTHSAWKRYKAVMFYVISFR
jgi:hypothetical protein